MQYIVQFLHKKDNNSVIAVFISDTPIHIPKEGDSFDLLDEQYDAENVIKCNAHYVRTLYRNTDGVSAQLTNVEVLIYGEYPRAATT